MVALVWLDADQAVETKRGCVMSACEERASEARAARGAGSPLPLCEACERVREADHRIANHLTFLDGYVRRTAMDLAKRPSETAPIDVQLALQAISGQITGLGRLHRALAATGHEVQTLRDLLHSVCRGIAALSDAFEIQEDLPLDCFVEADQAGPILQIVSEVVTNAAKHARSPDGRAIIRVRCGHNIAGRLQIEIADDGPGLPNGFDAATDGGLGFRLLRACAKQLQARADFRSSKAGVHFRLTLPPPGTQGTG